MNIIYIEDAPDVRDMVELLLQSWGHDVRSFESAEDASDALQAAGVDLLISDLELPGMSGLELMRQVMGHNGHVHGLLLTGHRAEMYRPHLPERVHILSKPFDVDELQKLLDGMAASP
jgi:DNA-binding NtrC family response regulator